MRPNPLLSTGEVLAPSHKQRRRDIFSVSGNKAFVDTQTRLSCRAGAMFYCYSDEYTSDGTHVV